MPRRGFYQGWTGGLMYGQASRRQALEEELGRGRMMLEQAQEERAMRREKFLEQVQRERSYEDDLASYRRLSEQYPEAGAEGLVQFMHESSRELSQDPEARHKAFDPETFAPTTRPTGEVRREAAEELMARFGQAKLGQLEAQRKAKMAEVLGRAGARPGATYMKDVEGMRKEAVRLRQLARYFAYAQDIEMDPVTGQITKMSRRADFPETPEKRALLDRQARQMQAEARELDARADALSQRRLGTAPGGLDVQRMVEILATQGFTSEEIEAFLRQQGVKVEAPAAR